jgi:beta-lactamase superfamily II metal-dependent hydrolase
MSDLEVIFMDAGQGDCTLIHYPDDSLTLVDCGSTKSGAQAFGEIKKVIDGKLNKQKKSVFFNLVLTHPDEDHYNLLQDIDIEKYLDAGGACYIYYGGDIELYQNSKDHNHTYDLLKHFDSYGVAFPPASSTNTEIDSLLSRAGVDVTILASNCTGKPEADDGPRKNANSIVLLVEYQGAKIFLMGDAFCQTEQFIIDAFNDQNMLHRLKKGPNDHVVLKMGHHGSDTSSGSDWVQLIEPEVIVVSSGTRIFNKKGMPTINHLNSTIGNTTLTETGIEQSYVVFDEKKRDYRDQAFVTMPKTEKAIWTTCYQAEWQPTSANWYEFGQTWYYGVEKEGKKTFRHWYGYTGYD